MTGFDPGPLADADLVADGDRWKLVLARDFRQSPQAVWQALTDPARLREWAPFTADAPADVRRADEPDVLEHAWGDDVLVWELLTTDAGTRLVLRHTLDDRSATPKMAAGWHLCLAVLQRLLDGDPVGPIVGEDAKEHGWDDLREQYAKVLDAQPY